MKKLLIILTTIILAATANFFYIIDRMAVMSDAIVIENEMIYLTKPACIDSIASRIGFGCCVSIDTLIMNGDTITDFSNIQ